MSSKRVAPEEALPSSKRQQQPGTGHVVAKHNYRNYDLARFYRDGPKPTKGPVESPKQLALDYLKQRNKRQQTPLRLWGDDVLAGKRWKCFLVGSTNEVIQLIKEDHTSHPDGANLFEHIFANEPTKPVLDLDHDHLQHWIDRKADLTQLVEHQGRDAVVLEMAMQAVAALRRFFRTKLQLNVEETNALVFTSCSATTYSLHLIIDQKDLYFVSWQEQCDMWLAVAAHNEDYSLLPFRFDLRLRGNRLLRCPFCEKLGSGRPMFPLLLPDGRKVTKASREWILRHMVTYVRGSVAKCSQAWEAWKAHLDALPPTPSTTTAAITAAPTPRHSSPADLQLASELSGVEIVDVSYREASVIAGLPAERCGICPTEVHHSTGSYFAYNFRAETAILIKSRHCSKDKHDFGAAGLPPVQRVERLDATQDPTVRQFVLHFWPPNATEPYPQWYVPTRAAEPLFSVPKRVAEVSLDKLSYSRVFAGALELNTRTFVVNAPPGTNKSGSCRDLCFHLAHGIGERAILLLLSPRQAHVSELQQRFEVDVSLSPTHPDYVKRGPVLINGKPYSFAAVFGQSLTHYSELKHHPELAHTTNAFIGTLESLQRLDEQRLLNAAPARLILYLDELVTLVFYLFTADYLDDSRAVLLAQLQHLISAARYVMVSDADLGPVLVRWILSLRPPKRFHPLLLNNTQRTDRRRYTIVTDNLDFWQSELFAYLGRSEPKVAIPCESRVRAEALAASIHAAFPHLNIRLFHAQIPDKRKASANLDAWLRGVDVFIYTSALGIGCDIQTEFKRMFACFDRRVSPNPLLRVQMLLRIRHLLDLEVLISMSALSQQRALEYHWVQAMPELLDYIAASCIDASKEPLRAFVQRLAQNVIHDDQIRLTSGKWLTAAPLLLPPPPPPEPVSPPARKKRGIPKLQLRELFGLEAMPSTLDQFPASELQKKALWKKQSIFNEAQADSAALFLVLDPLSQFLHAQVDLDADAWLPEHWQSWVNAHQTELNDASPRRQLKAGTDKRVKALKGILCDILQYRFGPVCELTAQGKLRWTALWRWRVEAASRVLASRQPPAALAAWVARLDAFDERSLQLA